MVGAVVLLAAFADVSIYQILLVAGVALFASVLGGVAGYGTGALMPLILVPMVGAEAVVPIIALASLLTNAGRTAAFLPQVSWRRVLVVMVGAIPPCLVTAYGYTMLTGTGAQIVIGTMLMLTVPLRYGLRRRAVELGDRGLFFGSIGYGALVGGTVGSGVILLSLLMAAGLQGTAVIATDAVLSIVIGIARIAVFGFAGVITAKVVAFALLIGLVAFPGAFLAKAFVARLPMHVHTAILDGVVLLGGTVMVIGALTH
ncbi:MAG: sulfite exporter TauE/SafE family protein [Rhizobiales bacterium]|nr:sulfite exporter TauE/SafE family protein [Hyphomicrobiales bacterium]